jgi:PAS domain S-box-containing protein
MRFALFDVGPAPLTALEDTAERERLLYDSGEARGSVTSDVGEPQFSRRLHIEVGGRIWEFRFTAPKAAIISRVDALLPSAVLMGGLLSSMLLFGLFYTLSSSRSRAVEIAKHITKDLRHSEASLAAAQRMARLGNWSLDPSSNVMTWSTQTCRLFGLERVVDRLTLTDFLKRIHEEDQLLVRQTLLGAIDQKAQRDIEHRIRAADGTTRWVHTIVQASSAEKDAPVSGTMMDITEQKNTEHALRASAEQLTALSRRLVDVQESERRKLSRALHDRVGQNLTALNINLDILRTGLASHGPPEHRSRLSDCSALLESTVDSIENVMSELRPPMLDDYGLLPALRWYAKDFSERAAIQVEVVGDDQVERLAPEIEITLFRIVQEALVNVAKHAQATHVRIELDQMNEQCTIKVRDNGIGMAGSRRHRPGLGMVTMRERAQAIGGRFDVHSVPASGTQISVEIPLYGHTHPDRR